MAPITEPQKSGKTWEPVEQIDEFHMHEVLHVSWVISEMWDDYIATHPAVVADLELSRQAAELQTKLYAFYQLVGNKRL